MQYIQFFPAGKEKKEGTRQSLQAGKNVKEKIKGRGGEGGGRVHVSLFPLVTHDNSHSTCVLTASHDHSSQLLEKTSKKKTSYKEISTSIYFFPPLFFYCHSSQLSFPLAWKQLRFHFLIGEAVLLHMSSIGFWQLEMC